MEVHIESGPVCPADGPVVGLLPWGSHLRANGREYSNVVGGTLAASHGPTAVFVEISDGGIPKCFPIHELGIWDMSAVPRILENCHT